MSFHDPEIHPASPVVCSGYGSAERFSSLEKRFHHPDRQRQLRTWRGIHAVLELEERKGDGYECSESQ